MKRLLTPDWALPANVIARVSTRVGGAGKAPYATFNLATHTGDSPEAVAENRRRLLNDLPDTVGLQWLEQAHGVNVVETDSAAAPVTADALITRAPGVACCILTADCLPLFIASLNGDEIALVHAGWRGMADGIIERTLARLQTVPDRLTAWLGPAIGACHFEVGPEVRERFLDSDAGALDPYFQPVADSDRLLADLYGIARAKLRGLGIQAIAGGGYCTFCDAGRFFSYRRDGRTGRMLSLIYLN